MQAGIQYCPVAVCPYPAAKTGVPMTTETLRWLFSITFDCVKENLNGFSDAEMLSDPKPAGNCAAWILGHIVCYRDNVLQILGAEPLMDTAVRPQFEYGVKSPDKSKFPPPSSKRILNKSS